MHAGPSDARISCATLEHGELRLRALRIGGARQTQRARIAQEAQQQLLLLVFRQRRIVRFDTRQAEQFGQRLLMPVGALPKVDSGEMKAEDLDGAAQRRKPPRHQTFAMVRAQRMLDRRQIVLKFARAGIRLSLDNRRPRRRGVRQRLQRAGQARINADERAPVRLVLAMRIVVARALGQRRQFRRTADKRQRDRELGTKLLNFLEIMAQRGFALLPHRIFQSLRDDVRIAVAVAADPRAHAEERRQMCPAEPLFKLGIEAWNLVQERRLVIAQRVLDLVSDRQTRHAQQTRLPHLHHPRRQQCIVADTLASAARALARRQQLRNRMFRVEQALAPNFGRMRGQDRRYQTAADNLDDIGCLEASLRQAAEGGGETPGLAVKPLLLFVNFAPPNVMPILGDIGQVGKVTEGARDHDRLFRRQAAQDRVERTAGFDIRVALQGNTKTADIFDPREHDVTFLLADGVAEDLTEQPDVVEKRRFLDGFGLHGTCIRRGGGGGVRFRACPNVTILCDDVLCAGV